MLNPDIEHLATDELIRLRVKIKRNNPAIHKFSIGTHNVTIEGKCVVTTISPLFESPSGETFFIDLVIKNHNLIQGYYKIYFNIGIKDAASGTTDYDIIKNVLFCHISYKNFSNKEAYSGWMHCWGMHYVESVNYEIH